MINRWDLILLELRQFFRNRSYLGLILILLALMILASVNSYLYTKDKKDEVLQQLQQVHDNDVNLIAQIDSFNQGLNDYETSYTLPTSGIRLAYNNHRVTYLPYRSFSLMAIGQGDLFSNYKKIVLYFNDSYESDTEELVSPLEQLFGQLDLAFVWVYLLPLIIILTSFNVLSLERESGRLSLIASQPVSLYMWLFRKIGIRYLILFILLIIFSLSLFLVFGVDIPGNLETLGQVVLILFLYSGFWFLLSFLVNLAGFDSGRSLIILTSVWVFFLFLVPSVVNLLAKEFIPLPSRLELVNHHQRVYNEMEGNLEFELEKLYNRHPDWKSDDPVTKDLSNSTGWNIQYLAKQYMAQLKHKETAEAYENEVEQRNMWVERLRVLSPSMIVQSVLVDMAGTSSRYYRSYLRQAKKYADDYRQYVFKGIFTNHAFSSEEIKNLPVFEFDSSQVSNTFQTDLISLIIYLVVLVFICLHFVKQTLI